MGFPEIIGIVFKNGTMTRRITPGSWLEDAWMSYARGVANRLEPVFKNAGFDLENLDRSVLFFIPYLIWASPQIGLGLSGAFGCLAVDHLILRRRLSAQTESLCADKKPRGH